MNNISNLQNTLVSLFLSSRKSLPKINWYLYRYLGIDRFIFRDLPVELKRLALSFEGGKKDREKVVNKARNLLREFFAELQLYLKLEGELERGKFGKGGDYPLNWRGFFYQELNPCQSFHYLKCGGYSVFFISQMGEGFDSRGEGTGIFSRESEEKFFFFIDIEVDRQKRELLLLFEHRPPRGEELPAKNYRRSVQLELDKRSLEQIFFFLHQEGIDSLLKARCKARLRTHLHRFTMSRRCEFALYPDISKRLNFLLGLFVNQKLFQNGQLGGRPDFSDKSYFQRELSKIYIFVNGAREIIRRLEVFEKFKVQMLLNKKKLIAEANYCITLNLIPRELWPEIAKNRRQIEEWKRIYRLEKLLNSKLSAPLSLEVMGRFANMMVDTQYFSPQFKLELLAKFERLEDHLDGELLFSDNYHALQLLKASYRESVNLIYLDPPYNAKMENNYYRDHYPSAVWMEILDKRLKLCREFLRSDGVLFASIGDQGFASLKVLLESHFGKENLLQTIIWKKRDGRGRGASHLIPQTEYIIPCAANLKELPPFRVESTDPTAKEYKYLDQKGYYKLLPLAKSGTSQTARPNLRYNITAPDGTIIQCPTHQWRWSFERFQRELAEGNVEFVRGRDGKWRVYTKKYLPAGEKSEPLNWTAPPNYYDETSTTSSALDLKNLFGENRFPFSKPHRLIQTLIRWSLYQKKSPLILDPYAGSGTTAHAVIELNRRDSGRRKYILIEKSLSLRELIISRIKKVVFSPNWQNGIPIVSPSNARGELKFSHFIKYIVLEDDETTAENFAAQIENRTEIAADNFSDEQILENCKSLYSDVLDEYLRESIRRDPLLVVETVSKVLNLKTEKLLKISSKNSQYIYMLGRTRPFSSEIDLSSEGSNLPLREIKAQVNRDFYSDSFDKLVAIALCLDSPPPERARVAAEAKLLEKFLQKVRINSKNIELFSFPLRLKSGKSLLELLLENIFFPPLS